MTNIICGECFNVSLFRISDGTELFSMQMRDYQGVVWKFNLGKAFQKHCRPYDHEDVGRMMNAKFISVMTSMDSKRKMMHYIFYLIYVF